MSALRNIIKYKSLITNCPKFNQNIVKSLFPAINTNSYKVSTAQHTFFSTKINQSGSANPSAFNPDDKQTLIYYGSLTPKIRAVKVFSLTTSMVGLAAQPMLMEQAGKLGGTAMIIGVCSFVGFFTFVTPLILHFITKKYVTEIHYDAANDEYTATTISFLLLKNQLKFKVQDVQVPEVGGMFATFNVKNKPLFVDVSMFYDTSHYVKMMGYDKPMDFQMGKRTVVEAPKSSSDKSTIAEK